MRNTCKPFFAAICIVLFCFAASAFPSEPAPASKPAPSANKGKTGRYQCHTSHEGYDYWVCVPKAYSDDNPAGLYVFFHGQGCPNTAFTLLDSWAGPILDPYNLICVAMQYHDGDNAKDTPGKVAAAKEAIAQTFADYKIVAGRGIIASFSGGGLPHGLFFNQSAKTRGAEWPFCQMSMYSSNFRVSVPGAAPLMGWCFSVGQKEWSLANLGKDATSHMIQLAAAAEKNGVIDLRLKVMKDKDHCVKDEEVQENARTFRRVDLAFAPFIYELDYTEKELAPIVRQANALSLGAPATALDRLIANQSTPEDVKKKATTLRQKIASRAAVILQLMNDLTADDALLCNYYSNIFNNQLSGLPEDKELRQALTKAASLKELPHVQPLYATFKKQLKDMFSGDGHITATAAAYLEQVQKAAGSKSQFGNMADEFLLLK